MKFIVGVKRPGHAILEGDAQKKTGESRRRPDLSRPHVNEVGARHGIAVTPIAGIEGELPPRLGRVDARGLPQREHVHARSRPKWMTQESLGHHVVPFQDSGFIAVDELRKQFVILK